jgi:hypothetical protein
MRNVRTAVAVVAVVAVVVGVVLLLAAFRGNRAAIAAARADAARVREQRDSLVTVIRRRDTERAALTVRIEQHRKEASGLRDSVTALERRRSAAQLAVRRLRTTGALLDRLRAAFPELGDSAWGLTTLPLPGGETLGIEVLTLPAWFTETFVIDRANADSWRAQKHRLLAADSLHHLVAALQDSVARLEAANANAYRAGYEAAYAGYQDLSARYVAQLARPRLSLGSAIGLLGAAGLGIVLGTVIP